MNNGRFDSLISRLEQTAAEDPRGYVARVLFVALLGFGVLGVAMMFALVPVAAAAGLVVLTIATGGKALLFILKLGKLLIILAIPGWVMIKSSVQMLLTRFPRPEGRTLTPSEAPELFVRIDELRARMNGPRIHHVLIDDRLNAGIVQHPRFGIFGWEENYLILGLPLLQTLNEEEALSVVAHEYGHLAGNHSRLGGFIYRFRAAWGRMQHISEEWKDWGSRLIARLFQWYAPYFNAYTFVLARQAEYVADRTAAEVVGAHHAANALMRTELAAHFENEVFWPAIDRMVAAQPQPLSDRSRFWAESMTGALDEPTRQRYLEIACDKRTDHLDTHPALTDRLKALGIAADEAAARALAPNTKSAAQVWLANTLPVIAGEFDRAWKEGASERWEAEHRHLDEVRKRRAELAAVETPSMDERWEYISLTREISPEDDVMPRLEALLELSPEHASARYLRGALLLDRGDDAGIADLEHVMEQDPDAILPACERAWNFYCERDPERAEHFRQRWIERSDHEDRVREEFRSLPGNATIAVHGLDAKDADKIRNIVEESSQYIRCAYLVRRVLKADPTLHDYVLAIETSRFTLGDKGPVVIKRLAAQEFPVKTFIVHLGTDTYKGFRKDIKRLGIEPIFKA